MILKRKENCKLIYVNSKYYIKTNRNLYHFNDNLVEAVEWYNNIKEIEKKGKVAFSQGKFKIELYPEELNDILHAIEFYKFSVDKSFYFKCDFESLKSKSFDLSFLYDYLFCIYNNYINDLRNNENRGETEKNTI